jgi:arylformamidase
VPLANGMPVWPGSVGFELTKTSTAGDGADATVSVVHADFHCGTHVDAPAHFVPGGAEIDDVPLETLVGPAFVVDLPRAERIGREELEELDLPADVERLLLRTRNSSLWADPQHDFRRDYVALTPDGARWVVGRGIKVVGVDYLSVQLFDDGPETHQLLLGAGVTIIEGLDLRAATPGLHTLVCLPVRIAGAEAAPARAVLLPAGEKLR